MNNLKGIAVVALVAIAMTSGMSRLVAETKAKATLTVSTPVIAYKKDAKTSGMLTWNNSKYVSASVSSSDKKIAKIETTSTSAGKIKFDVKFKKPGKVTVRASFATKSDETPDSEVPKECSVTVIASKVAITKFAKRMLVEGKFKLKAKRTPVVAGEKCQWTITGSGHGKFTPAASDTGQTTFTAKKITAPKKSSKIKVTYLKSKDKKKVKITKVKFAEYTGAIVKTGKQHSKFLYSNRINLIGNASKKLFDAEIYYRLLDQEKKFIGLSKMSNAVIYVKEKLNQFSIIFSFGVQSTDKWDAIINGLEDSIATPKLSIRKIPFKTRKSLKPGDNAMRFNLTWLATVDKLQKHKVELFIHEGFAKVTSLRRDPRTNQILQLGIGFAYRIKGAL